jgi:hypothetical protein
LYCPFPLGGSFDDGSDRTSCGDGRVLYKRSWGVSSAYGQGLLASRIHMTPKQLFKGKRKVVTITGRKSIECTVSSSYSGGIKMVATLTYTLTLKRIA